MRFNDPTWDRPENAMGRRHKELEADEVRAFGVVTVDADGNVNVDWYASGDDLARIASGARALEQNALARAVLAAEPAGRA